MMIFLGVIVYLFVVASLFNVERKKKRWVTGGLILIIGYGFIPVTAAIVGASNYFRHGFESNQQSAIVAVSTSTPQPIQTTSPSQSGVPANSVLSNCAPGRVLISQGGSPIVCPSAADDASAAATGSQNNNNDIRAKCSANERTRLVRLVWSDERKFGSREEVAAFVGDRAQMCFMAGGDLKNAWAWYAAEGVLDAYRSEWASDAGDNQAAGHLASLAEIIFAQCQHMGSSYLSTADAEVVEKRFHTTFERYPYGGENDIPTPMPD